MTDNRTNGQIVAKALVAHCEDHKMPFPRGSVKKIVEALRVAGRLAGEPTEAQVEAAWQSLLETATDVTTRRDIRAALVAAAGAAPQAEGAPTSSYISPSLPGMIRNLWKSYPSENSVRTALKLAGDLIQELIDLKASPVLPSSTVDEGKLTESSPRRLKSCVEAWPECATGEYNPSCCRFPKSCSATVYSAEYVTEDDLEPRAVVEAIGGESRA